MCHRLLVVIMVCMLVACGGEADTAGLSDTAPVQQVEAFVAATEARDVDAMLALLTPDVRRDAGWQLRQTMPQVERIAYLDPTYVLQANDGRQAFVEVSGLLVASTSDGRETEQPVTQLVELENIDGQWFITANGIQLPEVQR